jgi:Mn-dependent DtxR family transcriptional regulator
MALDQPTRAAPATASRNGRKPASPPASKTRARRRASGANLDADGHLLPFERVPLTKPRKAPTPAQRRAAAAGVARDIASAEPPPRQSAGGAWPTRRVAAESKLGPVAREALQTVRELRAKLGRKPTATDVAHRLGLSAAAVNAVLDELGAAGITKAPATVSEPQRKCLQAIIALEARLGRCPSTREVSAEMGLSPSAARFHIRNLENEGLVTPPEVRYVLTVTPAGRALAT